MAKVVLDSQDFVSVDDYLDTSIFYFDIVNDLVLMNWLLTESLAIIQNYCVWLDKEDKKVKLAICLVADCLNKKRLDLDEWIEPTKNNEQSIKTEKRWLNEAVLFNFNSNALTISEWDTHTCINERILSLLSEYIKNVKVWAEFFRT